MAVSACMQVYTRKMTGQILWRSCHNLVTGYRTAGTMQGFLQNEDLSFFQWPLRGALFPLKGLGIMNRQETRKLKQKVVLLCRRYRQKNCCCYLLCFNYMWSICLLRNHLSGTVNFCLRGSIWPAKCPFESRMPDVIHSKFHSQWNEKRVTKSNKLFFKDNSSTLNKGRKRMG